MAPVAGTLITFVRRKPVILNRPTSRSTYRSSLEFPLFLLNHRASSDYDATASTGERERERGGGRRSRDGTRRHRGREFWGTISTNFAGKSDYTPLRPLVNWIRKINYRAAAKALPSSSVGRGGRGREEQGQNHVADGGRGTRGSRLIRSGNYTCWLCHSTDWLTDWLTNWLVGWLVAKDLPYVGMSITTPATGEFYRLVLD